MEVNLSGSWMASLGLPVALARPRVHNYRLMTGVTWCGLFRLRARPGSRIRLQQHGTFVSCSQKNSQREFFCEQDQISSALPEANRGVHPDEHLIWN